VDEHVGQPRQAVEELAAIPQEELVEAL
jgi:hypothetical protein